jgi:regulator of sigma E protease
MFDTLRSILTYVFVLGVLVFFHELGHYLAARSRGVVVEVFSVGFGPALVSWRAKSGTLWKISVLPLGGYVKMQGWGEPNDPAPAVPGSFAGASLGSKAFIVAAGPLANLLLAFVLFSGLFMTVGRVVVQPVLSTIQPNSPAAAAGLLTGDRVMRIDGTNIRDFSQLQSIVSLHPDVEMDFTLLRQGKVIDQEVALGDVSMDGEKIGHLGVVGTMSSIQHFSPPAAVAAAGRETWNDASGMLAGLYGLVVHRQGLGQLAGPLGIAQITGQVAAMGFISVISFIAFLSINLGLVNLIPIPILDGGHLLFYAAEVIYGRPVPPRALDIGLRFGAAVIISLFFITTFNDLTRMGAVSWVMHLFG